MSDIDPSDREPQLPMPVVKQSIEEVVKTFLDQTGKNSAQALSQLQSLISKLELQIEEQIVRAIEDPEVANMNLSLLWGVVYAETGRASLGLIYKERQAVTAAIIGVIHGAIAAAIL